MKHKLLSILLCLAMALSLLPTAALAEETTANPVKIGETTEYETLDAAITAAKDGDTITILKAAKNESGYKLNGNLTYSGKAITIKAADGANVKFDMSAAVALHGAKITFEGVTFDYKTNGNYIGIQHADTLVYNNCTINGQVFLYAASETFNGCTFNQDSADAYNVWTYGAKKVEFNHCTFNCVGKSVLVYNEGAVSSTDLTVTDTEFKASAPVEGKAAIEIDTSLMKGQTKITVDQATADKTTGFGPGSNSGSSLWNDKKQKAESNENTTVVVAGTTVFAPPAVAEVGGKKFTTLAEAFAAANKIGDTVIELLDDINMTGKNWTPVKVDGYHGQGVITLNGNGKTITGLKAPLFAGGFGGTSGIVINNLTLENVNLNDTGSEYAGTGFGAFICAVDSMPTISLTNCHVKGGTIESTSGARVGGLIGWTAGYNDPNNGPVDTKVTLTNCSVKNVTIEANGSVGGLIGHAGANPATYHTITGCTVKDSTLKCTETGKSWRVGDLVGTANVGQVTVDAATSASQNILTQENADPQKPEDSIFGRKEVGKAGLVIIGNKVVAAGTAYGDIVNKNANEVLVEVSKGRWVKPNANTVAMIGATEYPTLTAAITAAKNGETVKLLKDVTEKVSISRNLVLDLNGKTLTGEDLKNSNGKHERIALTANAGKVEVKNGIIDGRVNAYDSADLTIDADVTVKNSYNGSGYDCFGIVVWGDGTFGQNGCKTPKLTVNGKVIMEKGGVAISTNGTDKSCAVVTINDGAVISTTEDGAIYLPSGKLTMNGGTVSGPTGIQICAGTADITADFKLNKGTVTATGTDQRTSKGTGDGLIPDGAAISVVNRNYPNGVPSVTINGGSFSSVNSDAVLAYTWSKGTASEWTNAKTYVKINDGYFTSDPSAYVVNNGSANIVKRDGSEGAYTYTVLARSSLTSGVYLTDPSGALASNYYVSSTANGVWTVSYSAPYSGGSSSYDPTYSVSTPSKTEHGTVTVSPKSASKGDTVTVTVKPDSGYVLETLTVTDKNGNELTLKDKGNGKYTFTMPAGKVEVKATFMEDNSMLNFFYDVPNNAYFYEAVKWAVENGITTGVGNDLFAPEQPCTRAQIVTFLWRAAGSPEPKGAASGMTDVVSGSYYEKAVAWAIENGITTGTTTSTFSPDATCTRAQAVTFLARALNAKAASAAEFSDVPTGSYFADAVAWAAANGVTEGIGGGLFGSDNDCTRGQIVTFLYRAYNK